MSRGVLTGVPKAECIGVSHPRTVAAGALLLIGMEGGGIVLSSSLTKTSYRVRRSAISLSIPSHFENALEAIADLSSLSSSPIFREREAAVGIRMKGE